MIAAGTTLVLSTDSDLFKFLKGIDPVHATDLDAAAPAPGESAELR